MPLEDASYAPDAEPEQKNLLRDLARQHTELAVEALAGVLRDDAAPAGARISAAKALLDFGWKKSAGDDDGDEPVKFAAQNWAERATN